jgi:hypothetical protein
VWLLWPNKSTHSYTEEKWIPQNRTLGLGNIIRLVTSYGPLWGKQIWGSHGGENTDSGLLVCDAVWSCMWYQCSWGHHVILYVVFNVLEGAVWSCMWLTTFLRAPCDLVCGYQRFGGCRVILYAVTNAPEGAVWSCVSLPTLLRAPCDLVCGYQRLEGAVWSCMLLSTFWRVPCDHVCG